MKLLAINVGRPQDVEWRGTTVRTSIFKTPELGRVHVASLNVDGDEQSDLTVHGGADKAVYVYPAEHYPFWRNELPDVEFPFGAFGENFTTEGLLESDVRIGDRLRVGTAEFMVTQPRLPCHKLNFRFRRPDMAKRFNVAKRTGFYLSVLRVGEVDTGEAIELVARDELAVTVADVTNLYLTDAANQDLLRRATELAALPASWREYFGKRLWEPDS
jgi:MOSC domain-containing protein YiiM